MPGDFLASSPLSPSFGLVMLRLVRRQSITMLDQQPSRKNVKLSQAEVFGFYVPVIHDIHGRDDMVAVRKIDIGIPGKGNSIHPRHSRRPLGP